MEGCETPAAAPGPVAPSGCSSTGDRRGLTPTILAVGPPLPSCPRILGSDTPCFMRRGSEDAPVPPPGEGHPCETPPEDPTLYQQPQGGDTRDAS